MKEENQRCYAITLAFLEKVILEFVSENEESANQDDRMKFISSKVIAVIEKEVQEETQKYLTSISQMNSEVSNIFQLTKILIELLLYIFKINWETIYIKNCTIIFKKVID